MNGPAWLCAQYGHQWEDADVRIALAGVRLLFMYCTRCRVLGLPEAAPREAGHER